MRRQANLLAALVVEVEQQAELARVEVVEVAGGVVPRFGGAVLVEGDGLDDAEGVDARLGLDAHDFRAEGGERLRGDGPGAEPGEVGDAHALEGQGRGAARGRRAARVAGLPAGRRRARRGGAGTSPTRGWRRGGRVGRGTRRRANRRRRTRTSPARAAGRSRLGRAGVETRPTRSRRRWPSSYASRAVMVAKNSATTAPRCASWSPMLAPASRSARTRARNWRFMLATMPA